MANKLIPADRVNKYLNRAVDILKELLLKSNNCTDPEQLENIYKETKLLSLIVKGLISPYRSILERTIPEPELENLKMLGLF